MLFIFLQKKEIIEFIVVFYKYTLPPEAFLIVLGVAVACKQNKASPEYSEAAGRYLHLGKKRTKG